MRSRRCLLTRDYCSKIHLETGINTRLNHISSAYHRSSNSHQKHILRWSYYSKGLQHFRARQDPFIRHVMKKGSCLAPKHCSPLLWCDCFITFFRLYLMIHGWVLYALTIPTDGTLFYSVTNNKNAMPARFSYHLPAKPCMVQCLHCLY